MTSLALACQPASWQPASASSEARVAYATASKSFAPASPRQHKREPNSREQDEVAGSAHTRREPLSREEEGRLPYVYVGFRLLEKRFMAITTRPMACGGDGGWGVSEEWGGGGSHAQRARAAAQGHLTTWLRLVQRAPMLPLAHRLFNRFSRNRSRAATSRGADVPAAPASGGGSAGGGERRGATIPSDTPP